MSSPGIKVECLLNVVKVSEYDALLTAVQHIARHAAYSRNNDTKPVDCWQTDVLIEEYCEGPEADCNFVLWKGEFLFFEVVVNFPCAGDNVAAGNFKETQLVFPSASPPEQQDVLRDSLLKSILHLGFHSGIFHVEARVRNSTHEYRPSPNDQGIDLHPRSEPAPSDASVFLIEINARPQGIWTHAQACFLTVLTSSRYRL
ncbi:uncharacterized protein DSM5745_04586 [Aspergillus mulundensis]|uniref:ATP-grasp domain-containing protein n=1 Tax=Aspergillus mulundensis TaxID=1810919 RepID=A0A3D8S411_9EURO|nr:hypothetical protein DSM5745_04586 [Aspergillus mulundensis]RDW81029.1 hypothetical protein DSM5745_04586 [Aspergillus mulundensis]